VEQSLSTAFPTGVRAELFNKTSSFFFASGDTAVSYLSELQLKSIRNAILLGLSPVDKILQPSVVPRISDDDLTSFRNNVQLRVRGLIEITNSHVVRVQIQKEDWILLCHRNILWLCLQQGWYGGFDKLSHELPDIQWESYICLNQCIPVLPIENFDVISQSIVLPIQNAHDEQPPQKFLLFASFVNSANLLPDVARQHAAEYAKYASN
jgi:hypothetical protein